MNLERISRFFLKRPWIQKTAVFVVAYAVWIAAFRLLVLTLVIWFLVSASETGFPKFEEVGDVFAANELSIIALGSLIFVIFFRAARTTEVLPESLGPIGKRIEKRFLPGFANGILVAIAVAIALILSGFYRYLGSFIRIDELGVTIASIVIRALSIGVLAYCEEYIFRDRILGWLRVNKGNLMTDAAAAAATGLLYCGIKCLQFDMGLMQINTLMLLSLAVSVRAMDDGDYGRGAGFIAGLLVVFHPILSLPIFGNDFSGIFLIKYQSTQSSIEIGRLLTGGAGGPLSSLALQMLLILDIARGLLRQKSFGLNAPLSRLNSR